LVIRESRLKSLGQLRLAGEAEDRRPYLFRIWSLGRRLKREHGAALIGVGILAAGLTSLLAQTLAPIALELVYPILAGTTPACMLDRLECNRLEEQLFAAAQTYLDLRTLPGIAWGTFIQALQETSAPAMT
jgi:hypothetical protein